MTTPDSSSVRLTKPVIGLIGGIGSGKSAAAGILAELGCFVCDSDGLARQALRDPAIIESLVQWWGRGILDEAGQVDRSAVARIVFNDAAERQRLEQLVHPWIEQHRRAAFAQASPTARALVIDAPLLLEAGLDRECDAVIFIDAPRELRLQRVREHRGWDAAELDRREESQLSLDHKRQRADYVVVNDVDLATLAARMRAILETIEQIDASERME